MALPKAAVIQPKKSLAVEWAHCGDRINSISPGCIGTELVLNAPSSAKNYANSTANQSSRCCCFLRSHSFPDLFLGIISLLWVWILAGVLQPVRPTIFAA